MEPTEKSSILDVGVNGDTIGEGDNYFEKLYPWPHRITALGIQDASALEKQYPGLKFVRGDGTHVPFADNSFDIAFSSAVAEHVGSFEKQKKFYAEVLRVGKKAFITTPDRLFPMEVHTGIPFLHWLPKRLFRKIMSMLGLHYFADEANLNLLTMKEVKKILAGRKDVQIVRKINSIIVIK